MSTWLLNDHGLASCHARDVRQGKRVCPRSQTTNSNLPAGGSKIAPLFHVDLASGHQQLPVEVTSG